VAIGPYVLTWGHLEITFAIFEHSLRVGAGWHVIRATNKIEDVLAVVRFLDRIITGFETEGTRTDEKTPVIDLRDFTTGSREIVRENKSSKGISREISTVRIKLSATVGGIQTNAGLVELPSNLNVGGGPHELKAGEGSCRDNASAVTMHSAVSHDCSFNITNQSIGSWRSPKTEVFDGIDEHGLALGVRPFGCTVANIVPRLRTTTTRERVDLLGKVWIVEGILGQREWSACWVRNGNWGRYRSGQLGEARGGQ